MNTVRSEYEKHINPLLSQMEEISKAAYTVYGYDGLKLALGPYQAEHECFTVTIASSNIQRKIHPYQYFQIVTSTERQAKRVGIHKGDIIIRYNGHDVRPRTDWIRLKQTVIENETTMEIDRKGQAMTFKLAKGRIGSNTRADDYMPDLEPDQFMINGRLFVPRSEARLFKQNFLNGFITAEVKVTAKTPEMSLITSAQVIDESNEKRYDLLKSEYLCMGNRLVFDNKNQIYWIAKKLHKLTFSGAQKFLNEFEFNGVTGWSLPDMNNLKSIRNSLVTWKNGYYRAYLYTSTLKSNSRDHIQYRLNDGDIGCCRDKDYESVVGIAKELGRSKYDIFADRYIAMDNDLVFDTIGPLVWLFSATPKKCTYLEAQTYIKQLEAHNLKGWRLPSFYEFKALRDPAVPGVDQRYKDRLKRYFYTSSHKSDNKNHIQYRPSDGDTGCCGDHDTEAIIGVM